MRILALDIGSTSVKAGLWTGRSFSARSRVPFPTRFAQDTAEMDAPALLAAILRAGDRVLTGSIDAVAYCTFSSGVVMTDRRNKPLTPIITHADRRSSATALSLVKQRPKSWWLQRTGNLPYPGGIGSSTLAWLHANHPALFGKPHRAGQASSFIGAFLTGGSWCIDPSQAVFLGLWDIHRNRWNADACRLVGISPEALPECRWADDALGALSAAVARLWNITAGVPVLGGFVDTSAAVIQTPMRPGQIAHNAGSTDVLALCIDRPRPAEGILSRPVGVSGSFSGAPGRPAWLAVRTIASAGSAVEWIRRTLFPKITDAQWRRLVTRTARHLLQNEDDSVQCLPTFAGERASMCQPPGASFAGMRLSTAPGDLLESVIRGLAIQSARNYALLAPLHTPQKTVYTMGGASAIGNAMHARWPGNHVYRQLSGDGLRGLVLLAERSLARKPDPSRPVKFLTVTG